MTETIKFFLQWEEYYAAQEFFRRDRQSFAPEWIVGGLLTLIGLAMLALGEMLPLAAVALLIGLAVIFAAPLARRLASKRKWLREPLFETEHEVSFSEDGVYFRMGVIESNLNWRYYQRMMVGPDGLLMVYGDDSFNFLPKRAFADEKQLNEFRALAASKLK